MSSTSSTPASAARSSTCSITSWRMSGRSMGGQGQRDVVEGDGQPHPRAQQGGKRVSITLWVEQRVADGSRRVGKGVERLGGVDHPAAFGKTLEREPLPVPEQRRWGGAIDIEHEAGPGAHRVGPFRLLRFRSRWSR